jgi:hypothetical protein
MTNPATARPPAANPPGQSPLKIGDRVPDDRRCRLGNRGPVLPGYASAEPEPFGEVGPKEFADLPVELGPNVLFHSGRIAARRETPNL